MRRSSFVSRHRRGTALVVALLAAAGVGLAGTAVAGTDAETSDVAKKAHAEPVTPGTPCSVSARACVDLDTQRAWLVRDGRAVRGPVPITSGGSGTETPIGHSFRVYRKNKDHVSGEYQRPDGSGVPMPYAVFFADGGVAFHGGDPSRSTAGCVKLEAADARAWFDTLATGDLVQVVRASTERDARAAVV